MRKSNGFVIALAGFALLSCGDAVIKSMAGEWPATAIAALRFCIAIPLLGILVLAQNGKQALVVRRPVLQAARGVSIAFASLLFFLSLFFMPQAEATAIVFVNPILTAILSMVFLRERMNYAGWASAAVALCGVALILRPNLAELGLIALLPLVAAFFFACMMIFNRMAAGTGTAVVLQFYLALAATPLLMLFAVTGHYSGIEALQVTTPDWSIIARCAIVAVSASLAHGLIYVGTTRANAAVAAQAVYIQLPVALAIDAFIFRHWPDLAAMIGVVLIISAGLVNGLIPLMRRK
ncbi:MAG: DMT family transporter [Sphingorhabdus sp.]|jgi:drug/metabolite transporter (DMT)-like permease|uniref:DMT family transporter n=1 Tax=Sphingorhabdus sp. TaxID=1902408 RepID=UPI003BAE52EE|nr:DMT family transporter [Sphingomonadales bacterium]